MSYRTGRKAAACVRSTQRGEGDSLISPMTRTRLFRPGLRAFAAAAIALFTIHGLALAETAPPAAPPQQDGAQAVRVLRDLPYVEDGHERQKLDLYLPQKPAGPLLVWIHGGGWREGSKANPPGLAVVENGVAVASIGYRLSQHALFPAQIEDCKAAIRWLRAHAAEYGYDPQKIAVWGESAGDISRHCWRSLGR